jgi:hypothetical protein
MSALDDILGDLSRSVGALPTRATSTLFAASAAALRPAFKEWATARGGDGSRESSLPLLKRAIEIGFELARSGTTQADLPAVLRQLEWITPVRVKSAPSSITAQDCVICADVAIRVHVEPAFSQGPVIEYALEPILLSSTARVSAMPDLPDPAGGAVPATADALLEDSRVLAAVEFMWVAIMRLRSKPEPDPATIDEVRLRAVVLMP